MTLQLDRYVYITHHHTTPHHICFMALFREPPGRASARTELLDFMVQGKINRGRHTTIWLGATPTGLTSAHLHHPLELDPHLTQCCLGRGLPPHQVASSILHPSSRFVTTDMGRKLGGLCPFGGGAVSPSNTMCPGLRSTSVPTDILIHHAIWPQQTWAKNFGGCAPFGEGKLGPHLTQCGLCRGLAPRQVSS